MTVDATYHAACCNPDCDRPGTVYVGDLTTLGDWACSLCEVYIVGDGNDE